MLTICFVGNFIERKLQRNKDEKAKYCFIDKVKNLDFLIKKYDYVFLTNDNREWIVWWCFPYNPIRITIKSGTVEKCAESIINFCSSCIGVDMADFYGALREGEKEIHFYSFIELGKLMNYKLFFNTSVGTAIKIYLSKNTEISLDEIYQLINKIYISSNEMEYLVFNLDCLEYINKDLCDLFITIP